MVQNLIMLCLKVRFHRGKSSWRHFATGDLGRSETLVPEMRKKRKARVLCSAFQHFLRPFARFAFLLPPLVSSSYSRYTLCHLTALCSNSCLLTAFCPGFGGHVGAAEVLLNAKADPNAQAEASMRQETTRRGPNAFRMAALLCMELQNEAGTTTVPGLEPKSPNISGHAQVAELLLTHGVNYQPCAWETAERTWKSLKGFHLAEFIKAPDVSLSGLQLPAGVRRCTWRLSEGLPRLSRLVACQLNAAACRLNE